LEITNTIILKTSIKINRLITESNSKLNEDTGKSICVNFDTMRKISIRKSSGKKALEKSCLLGIIVTATEITI